MKKEFIIKCLITWFLQCISNSAIANDTFTVNDVEYSLITTTTVALEKMTVPYGGNVVFPSKVEYKGRTFTVTRIGNDVFRNPEKLLSLVIPSSIEGFGMGRGYNRQFLACVNLNKIVIEDSDSPLYMSESGEYRRALFYNSPLEDIYIGRNIKYDSYIDVGGDRFADKKFASPFKKQNKLKKVTIGERVTELNYGMFWGCEGLEEIEIPREIKEIPFCAFYCCESLSKVILHEGLQSIGECAFYLAPISTMSLPNSVIKLEWSCMAGNKLKTLVINDNIKEIPTYAFSSSSLKKVVIGRSVEILGFSIFGNSSLEEIECRIPDPSKCKLESGLPGYDEETFSVGNFTWTTLYIPFGTIKKYKSYYPWEGFVNIIEKISLPNVNIEVTTSSDGYATFYDSQYSYSLPSDLSAYVISGITNNKLLPSKINGSIVPKGVPVILVSTNKVSKTYTLTSTDSSASYTGTNYLRGSDSDATTTGDGYHYKLCYGDGSSSNFFGWYWGADNGRSFAINEHKAWLVIPKSDNAPTRSFIVNNNNK